MSFDYYQVTSGNQEETLNYHDLAQEIIKFKKTESCNLQAQFFNIYENVGSVAPEALREVKLVKPLTLPVIPSSR